MDVKMTDPLTRPFHLFGNLWLEDPTNFLGTFDASNMDTNMALIRFFDQDRKGGSSFPGIYLFLFILFDEVLTDQK
jgi:hypothetical protein